jgi:hypothetical protein
VSFSIHPAACAELNAAVDYYEEAEPGLGYEFLEEVYATIHRAIAHPTSWQQISARTRRCLTQRFPYSVIYQVQPDSIGVFAIASTHRRPEYWLDRLDTPPEPAS